MAQIAANTLEERIRALSAEVRALSGAAGWTSAEALPAVAAGTVGPSVDVLVSAGGALSVWVSASLAPGAGTASYGYRLTGPTPVPGDDGAEVAAADPARAVSSTGTALSAGLPMRHTGLVPGWYRVTGSVLGAGTVANRRLHASAS